MLLQHLQSGWKGVTEENLKRQARQLEELVPKVRSRHSRGTVVLRSLRSHGPVTAQCRSVTRQRRSLLDEVVVRTRAVTVRSRLDHVLVTIAARGPSGALQRARACASEPVPPLRCRLSLSRRKHAGQT